MTQMLIPALICAITVVSVLHSELEDVQTAFRYPSSRSPARFQNGLLNQGGYAQGPEVVRRGYVYCVRYEGTNKHPHQRWPFSLFRSPASVSGNKRTYVRQHTLKVLTFIVPDRPPPRGRKKEKKKKRKKEYAENVHSRDPRRAWRSGAKALQDYKACCLTF